MARLNVHLSGEEADGRQVVARVSDLDDPFRVERKIRVASYSEVIAEVVYLLRAEEAADEQICSESTPNCEVQG